MLDIQQLNYTSPNTVYFQRITVILSECLLFYAIIQLSTLLTVAKGKRAFLVALAFANPNLIIVDHIHFQYNGFLYGIQLLSVCAIFKNQWTWAAVYFAAVLNFKHIFLYQAPAYFIYLLKAVCFDDSSIFFKKVT
jgi:alpha-1,3-glucosyltransferase